MQLYVLMKETDKLKRARNNDKPAKSSPKYNTIDFSYPLIRSRIDNMQNLIPQTVIDDPQNAESRR